MQTRLFVPVEAETEHIACLQMVIVDDDISTNQVASLLVFATTESLFTLGIAISFDFVWLLTRILLILPM